MCCSVHGDIFHPPRLLVDAVHATLTECVRVTGYTSSSPARHTRLHKRARTHTLLAAVMTMQGTILSYGAIRVSDVSGWGPHSLMNAAGEVHHPGTA